MGRAENLVTCKCPYRVLIVSSVFVWVFLGQGVLKWYMHSAVLHPSRLEPGTARKGHTAASKTQQDAAIGATEPMHPTHSPTVFQWNNATPQTQMPAMYGRGGGPRILGLESCQKFREITMERVRHVAHSGLFNTGTNLLEQTFARNPCARRDGTVTVDFQVPWGKHNPVSWRGTHIAVEAIRKHKRNQISRGTAEQLVNISHVLPVVLVKDPLTWMKSMCRNLYDITVNTHSPSCPSPLAAYQGQPSDVKGDRASLMATRPTAAAASAKAVVKWQGSKRVWTYDSMVHLWSRWNGAYANLNTSAVPRLMVRYEDLIFDTERTMATICECTGAAKPAGVFEVQEASSKTKGSGKGEPSDRAKALTMYSSPVERVKGYTDADFAFMRAHLDPYLISFFHYFLPGDPPQKFAAPLPRRPTDKPR